MPLTVLVITPFLPRQTFQRLVERLLVLCITMR